MASKSELSKKYYGKSYSSLNSRQKQQVDRDVGRNTTPVRKRSSSPSSTPADKEKKTIVVGVETTPSGLISRQVNVGKDLSSEQRKAISDAVSAQAQARQEEVFVVGVQDPTISQSREINQSLPAINQSREANLNLIPATEFVAVKSNPEVITSRQGGRRTAQVDFTLAPEQEQTVAKEQSRSLIPGEERRRRGGEFIEQLVDFSANEYSEAKQSFGRGDPFGGTIALARSVTPLPLLIGSGSVFVADLVGSSAFSAATNPQARAAAGSAISSFLVNNPGRTTLNAGRQLANTLGEEFLRSPPLFIADLFVPLPPASAVTKPVSSTARAVSSTTRSTLSNVFSPVTTSRTTARNVGLSIEDVVGSYPIRNVGGEIVERQRTLTGEINPNARFNERAGLPEELIFEPSGRPSSPVERRQFTENLLDSSKQKQSTLTYTPTQQELFVDDVTDFINSQNSNKNSLIVSAPSELQTKLKFENNNLVLEKPIKTIEKPRTALEIRIDPTGSRGFVEGKGFKLFGGSKRGSANIDPNQFLDNVRDLFSSSDSVLDDWTGGSRSSRSRRTLPFSSDELNNPLSQKTNILNDFSRASTTQVTPTGLLFVPSVLPFARANLINSNLSLNSSVTNLLAGTDNNLLSLNRASTNTLFGADSVSRTLVDSPATPAVRDLTDTVSQTLADTPSRTLVDSSSRPIFDSPENPRLRPRVKPRIRTRPKRLRTPRLRLDLDFDFDSNPSSSKGYRFVVGRQGNKNVSSFSSSSLSKGTRRAKNLVGNSLSASFSVTKGGKPISSNERTRIKNSLGKEFRPAKKIPNSFVEKKKYRLDSPEEKASIKRAKSQRLTGSASLFNSALRDVNNGISLRRSRRRLF